MVRHFQLGALLFLGFLVGNAPVLAQQAGGIRGVVYDPDFKIPLARAQVTIVETGQTVESGEEGNYAFTQLEPGTYTLIFFRQGYARQVKSDVVVSQGQLTEVDVWLTGDFMEMEEYVVQDIQLGGGTEAALLELRLQSPVVMDAISADLMSRAGAGDAASALRLVAGTSLQDDKFAVVRGLPNRYVNSQMNSVRLPSADADTRSVELDQFPSQVIENIQVSKTFTPDQQGDASGGAVNVVMKGIPEETILKAGIGTEFNTQVFGQNSFLSYPGGGLDAFGQSGDLGIPDDGGFSGPYHTQSSQYPYNMDFDTTFGGSHEISEDLSIGGFGSLFYERDSSHYEDGIDDKYWVEEPGGPMVPQYIQGTPQQGDFKTQLFDVSRSSESVQWGGLGGLGIETEDHSLTIMNLFTRDAEETATIAEDTRGKEYFFPGHDPNDPTTPGHDNLFAAPYLRTETLQYLERTTQSFQINGQHTIPLPEWGVEDLFLFQEPELDWTFANSTARKNEPNKKQFGSFWLPGREVSLGDQTLVIPPTHRPFKPAENFTLGNLQQTWENIKEESDQLFWNLKYPFEQWTNDEGYFKVGMFWDQVKRNFSQETFSNFNNNSLELEGGFEESFSEAFPTLPSAGEISAGPPFVDVDYEGEQTIAASYGMIDIPLTSAVSVIGGARFERTEISIVNFPERDVTWIPPGSSGQVALNPGDADVNYEQSDVLPSIGIVYNLWDDVTLRGSFSKTIARMTFKELSPIQQQEFLGGDVFIGNPFLSMSELYNYDLRIDYSPYQGSLASVSYFYKDITDPIEYVQRFAGFTFTTPVNYPEGEISGFEFEVRQQLQRFWEDLEGLSLGANATLIDSKVVLPEREAEQFSSPNIQAPMTSRDMTNAPEYLYNLFMTYDLNRLGLEGTELSLFYTVTGDKLVAGAARSGGNFVPNIYATEYGTLNLSLNQALGENFSLKFQAKNLTNPSIETVYRSPYIAGDVPHTSYREGMDFSISVQATF